MSSYLRIFPSASTKAGAPIIRLTSIRFWVFPKIEITVRIVIGFIALHKPLMLIRSMVYHKIQNNFDSTGMCLFDQAVHILVCSKFVIYFSVITDIVPIIILRRIKHRTQPDCICPKLFDIIQFFYNSVQISESISVRVFKTSRINLVYN